MPAAGGGLADEDIKKNAGPGNIAPDSAF